MLALVSIGIALWVFSELIGDSRMVETMGVVTESESVLPGTSISPPELSDMPCRYPSGSGFWSAFSSGWFIAEHDAGAVLFCSGHRDVGTEVAMWVSPGDPSNGRLVAPTFTIGQAILWLVAVLLIAGGLGWAWVKMH